MGTIWQLNLVDTILETAFEFAGQPDQVIIDRALRDSGRTLRPQSQPEIPRYYYLLREDARVRLTIVGTPLDRWPDGEGAMLVVGTLVSLGEFEKTRHLRGKLTLNLKMQSLAEMQGQPKRVLKNGQTLLDEISLQVLDRESIELAQQPKKRKHGRWEI